MDPWISQIENDGRDKPRILVNATTLTIGGGVSVGVSFVTQACRPEYNKFEFLFAVSEQIYSNLSSSLRSDNRLVVAVASPARPIKGHKTRLLLKGLERRFRPDIVFSLGLPSYTRFSRPEVGRYTNPWEINHTSLPWGALSLVQKIHVFLLARYRLFWAKRAVFFLTQTEPAKNGIMRNLRVGANRVKVVANSINPIFRGRPYCHGDPDRVLIFCLAAGHIHKNLLIIPDVALALRRIHKQKKIVFVVTLCKEGSLARRLEAKSRRLGVEAMIENVGPLRLDECVSHYERCSIVFLPTLLEVFSATYLEAMAMAKPIVTTDRDFARSVCGDAAIYFDPNRAADAAFAIAKLIDDPLVREDLIERGRRRLRFFPTPDEQHQMVFSWLWQVVQVVRGVREDKDLSVECECGPGGREGG